MALVCREPTTLTAGLVVLPEPLTRSPFATVIATTRPLIGLRSVACARALSFSGFSVRATPDAAFGRFLIVTADDFGLHAAVNEAVERLEWDERKEEETPFSRSCFRLPSTR